MTKAEKIEEMLRRYEEAREPMHRSGEIAAGEHGLLLMPATWNGSYRELERCLLLLREDAPSVYWHLSERYLRCEQLTLECRVHNGRVKLPPHCELAAGAPEIGTKVVRVHVRRWSSSVRAEKVRRGLVILAAYFEGEPYLPQDMVAA